MRNCLKDSYFFTVDMVFIINDRYVYPVLDLTPNQ